MGGSALQFVSRKTIIDKLECIDRGAAAIPLKELEMKGKAWLSVAFLVLVAGLTIGCGATVSQEEHDEVVAELAACQAEVESLESETQEAQERAAEAEAAAATQHSECQSELEATQAELADLQARVREAAVASEMLSVFMNLALSGEEISNEDAMAAFLEVSAMIQESGDEVLQEKLAALALSQNMEQDSIDLVVYLLEKVATLSEE